MWLVQTQSFSSHCQMTKRLTSERNGTVNNDHLFEIFNDSETSMLPGIPESAMCVQRFDDSLNSAIHTTYRISLRSSSLREPRDPLPKVVFVLFRYKSRSD